MSRDATSIMNIRRFDERDRASLRDIYLTARVATFHWLDTGAFKPEDFDAATGGERVWVAERDGTLLGFASVWMPDNFLHSLFVHPDSQGSGAGKALLSVCIAATGGRLSLKCLCRNENARDFYLSQGWQIRSREIGPDGDCFVMHFDS